MIRKEDCERRTEELLKPITEANGFEIVDVEYVKEGSTRFLRAYIDKPGGIRIDDCELVSRALDAALDKADFIDEPYTLEISSPGLLRPLKKDRDYERNLGKEIEVQLFKAMDKQKEFIGVLCRYDAESAVITEEDGTERTFARRDISLARPYIDFSDL